MSEPYVAHVTSEAIEFGSTMFIGNSMPIRDADMYGSSHGKGSYGKITKLPSGVPLEIEVLVVSMVYSVMLLVLLWTTTKK